jgi:hypothetical protein
MPHDFGNQLNYHLHRKSQAPLDDTKSINSGLSSDDDQFIVGDYNIKNSTQHD